MIATPRPRLFRQTRRIVILALFFIVTGGLSGAGIDVPADLTNSLTRRRPVRPDPVRTWLRANGVRLETVEGTGPVTDLLPLSPWIADAEIIALGDGTHGTHEYYTVKRRIIQYLAESGIARTIGFEGPWPEFLRLNDYIHGGEGNTSALFDIEFYFFWEVEEMVDFVEWAREFNASRPPEEQIELIGLDILSNDLREAADLVIEYLGDVDSGARAVAVDSYDCVGDQLSPAALTSSSCAPGLTRVRETLEENAETYEEASSRRAFDRALHSARVIEQTSLLFKANNDDALRDEFLAEHARWFADEWTGAERLVVWGHNEHLGTLPAVGEWKSMGEHLRETYGARYFSIGTCMLEGALLRTDGPNLSVAEMQSPLETNYELQFAKAGYDAIVIPLFHPDTPDWLAGPANLRFGTASYDPERAEYHNPSYSLPDKFDAIIFIRSTTPAIPVGSDDARQSGFRDGD